MLLKFKTETLYIFTLIYIVYITYNRCRILVIFTGEHNILFLTFTNNFSLSIFFYELRVFQTTIQICWYLPPPLEGKRGQEKSEAYLDFVKIYVCLKYN